MLEVKKEEYGVNEVRVVIEKHEEFEDDLDTRVDCIWNGEEKGTIMGRDLVWYLWKAGGFDFKKALVLGWEANTKLAYQVWQGWVMDLVEDEPEQLATMILSEDIVCRMVEGSLYYHAIRRQLLDQAKHYLWIKSLG